MAKRPSDTFLFASMLVFCAGLNLVLSRDVAAETTCTSDLSGSAAVCTEEPSAATDAPTLSLPDIVGTELEVGTVLPTPMMDCTIQASDTVSDPSDSSTVVSVLTVFCSAQARPVQCPSTETANRTATYTCGNTAPGECRNRAQRRCYEALEEDATRGCPHTSRECLFGARPLAGRCVLVNEVPTQRSNDIDRGVATAVCYNRCAYTCRRVVPTPTPTPTPRPTPTPNQTPTSISTPSETAAPTATETTWSTPPPQPTSTPTAGAIPDTSAKTSWFGW